VNDTPSCLGALDDTIVDHVSSPILKPP